MSASNINSIREKIREYSAVVENSDPSITARVKKRAYQKLGKLKKELQAAEERGEGGNLSGNKRKDAPGGGEENNNNDDDSNSTHPLSSAATAAATVPVNRKALKAQLRMLNQELAVLAQKKQLKSAVKRFEQGVRKGVPVDIHSYTNLMNAYVRCNDVAGAEQTLSRMRAEAGILPNVITYTILLKGYCELGLMTEARLLFFQVMKQECRPNLRSLNAFLRGTARVGAAASALEALNTYIAAWTASSGTATSTGGAVVHNTGPDSQELAAPDASTFEYVVGVLCRACRADEALQIVSNIAATSALSSSAIDNAAVYLWFAKMYALLGSSMESSKWLTLSDNCREMARNSKQRTEMLKKFSAASSAHNATNSGKSAGGSSGAAEGEGAPSKSVELFLQHKNSELEKEASAVREYLGFCRHSLSTHNSNSNSTHSGSPSGILSASAYVNFLSRVLYFGYDGKGDLEGEEIDGAKESGTIATRLLYALRSKFGLDQVSQYIPLINETNAVATGQEKEAKNVLKATKRDATAKLLRSIDESTGYVNMAALFGIDGPNKDEDESDESSDIDSVVCPSSSAAAAFSHLPPIKMEVCSGNGEWVVAQAAADAASPSATDSARSSTSILPKALWVALELRCDRVHNIMCSKLFSEPPRIVRAAAAAPISSTTTSSSHKEVIDNFAILGGDASKILPERIKPGCISELFINHPQPPDHLSQLKSGESAASSSSQTLSQGQHLLTAEFFADMHRVLCKNGTLTIVSDNLSYMQLLASILCSFATSTTTGCRSSSSRSSSALKGFFASAFVEAECEAIDVRRGGARQLQERRAIPIGEQRVPPALNSEAAQKKMYAQFGSGQLSTSVSKISSSSSSRGGDGDGGGGNSSPRSHVIEIWRGDPSVAEGHTASASSYFDRMWELGQKKRRWFMYLRKVE